MGANIMSNVAIILSIIMIVIRFLYRVKVYILTRVAKFFLNIGDF
jgi:hypothetical protein